MNSQKSEPIKIEYKKKTETLEIIKLQNKTSLIIIKITKYKITEVNTKTKIAV